MKVERRGELPLVGGATGAKVERSYAEKSKERGVEAMEVSFSSRMLWFCAQFV